MTTLIEARGFCDRPLAPDELRLRSVQETIKKRYRRGRVKEFQEDSKMDHPNHRSRLGALIACLVLSGLSPACLTEEVGDPDEQLLQQANLRTDGAGLLEFLRN